MCEHVGLLLDRKEFIFYVKYGRTDGWTDGRTDGRTDRPSYRDAMTHLKKGELQSNQRTELLVS